MTAKELEDMLEMMYDALYSTVIDVFVAGNAPMLDQLEQERVCADTAELIQLLHVIHMHYDKAAWDDVAWEQWFLEEPNL